jgi:hypothetical protein
MAKVSIAVLDPATVPYYSLQTLIAAWQQRGIATAVDRGFAGDADACLVHVDRTVVAPDMFGPVPADVPVMNGRVLDISKRRLSRLEVRPGDDWDGPVIVKTVLNHYGDPEKYGRRPTRAERNRRRMSQISWRSARQLPPKDYPVLDHWRRVPRWVWENPFFLVERLVTERDGTDYVLRGWMCLGDRGFGWRMVSAVPVIRIRNCTRFDFTTEVPDEVRATVASEGFDYGKFDFVMTDGGPVVFDFNKTPAMHLPGIAPYLESMAAGIDRYLG